MLAKNLQVGIETTKKVDRHNILGRLINVLMVISPGRVLLEGNLLPEVFDGFTSLVVEVEMLLQATLWQWHQRQSQSQEQAWAPQPCPGRHWST